MIGKIYRAKRELIESSGLDIPKKHNLVFDASTDFRDPSGGWEEEHFTGEKIKIINLPFHQYEYLYIPYSVIGCYIHTLGGRVRPVLDYQFIPLYKVDKLILIRPTGITTNNVYFQYFLTDTLTPIKIYDVYEEIGFTLVKGSVFQKYELPFPSFQLKVLLKLPTNPTSIDYNISSYLYNDSGSVILDDKNGIAGAPLTINNIYRYDLISGSGEVTEPHYPFPSWRTHIGLINNDAGTDIPDVRLKVISWED